MSIINKRNGRLVAIEEFYDSNNIHYIKCRCDCGKIKNIRRKAFCPSGTKSCGCLRSERIMKHQSGEIKHNLKRLKRTTRKDNHGAYYWKCECLLCGKIIQTTSFGKQKACGCLNKSVRLKNHKDIAGETKHFLKSIEKTDKRTKEKSCIWKFQCLLCNKIIELPTNRFGIQKSCGCLTKLNNFGMIYAVICPVNKKIVYIGQTTTDLKCRIITHKYAAKNKNTPFNKWYKKNINAQFIILQNNIDINLLNQREKYYISKYHNLLNVKNNE